MAGRPTKAATPEGRGFAKLVSDNQREPRNTRRNGNGRPANNARRPAGSRATSNDRRNAPGKPAGQLPIQPQRPAPGPKPRNPLFHANKIISAQASRGASPEMLASKRPPELGGNRRASNTTPNAPRRNNLNEKPTFSFDRLDKKRDVTPTSGSYSQRLQQLKTHREREREEAVEAGFLADRPRALSEAITPVGTCQSMCPEFERVERVIQKDVWGAEKSVQDPSADPQPDESLMVKKFRRSAAGTGEQLPSDLRPPSVLTRTVDYLFDTVLGNKALPTVHHFIWDRTRAIRNDFSIQQVSRVGDVAQAVDCYERIARFHIMSLHQLAGAEKPYDQYDAQQEREQLDKTLLSLIQYYDDNRGRFQSRNEPEFRAYCIVFQIQNPAPDMEDRVQLWPKNVLRDSRVRRALDIYASACNTAGPQGPLKPYAPHPVAQNNWEEFWQLVGSDETPYLMACVAEMYFPLIRKATIISLWQTFRQSSGKPSRDWSLEELARLLFLDDEEECEDFLEKFGFTVNEDDDDGKSYVDLSSVAGRSLPDPALTPVKSEFLEEKRYGRKFSAIVRNMSVEEATSQGLVEDEDESQDEDSADNSDDQGHNDHANLEAQTAPNAGVAAGLSSQQPQQTNFNALASSFTPQSTSSSAFGNRNNFIPSSQDHTWKPTEPIKFGQTSGQPQTDNPDSFASFANQGQSQPNSSFPGFGKSSSNPASLFLTTQAASFQPAQPEQSNSHSHESGNLQNPNASHSTSTGSQNERPRSLFDRIEDSNPSLNSGSSGFKAPPQSRNDTGNPAFNGSAKPNVGSAGLFKPNHNEASSRPTSSSSLFPNTDSSGSGQAHVQQSSGEQNAISDAQALEYQRRQREAEEQRLKEAEERKKKEAEQQREVEEKRRREVEEQKIREAETKRKRQAEELERKRQEESQVLDDLSQHLMLKPYGFLEQFVEYAAGPIIRSVQERVRLEEDLARADQYRQAKLSTRYGKLWRAIHHKRHMARLGKERRKRRAEAMQAKEAGAQRQGEINGQKVTSINGSQEPLRQRLEMQGPSKSASGSEQTRLAASTSAKASTQSMSPPTGPLSQSTPAPEPSSLRKSVSNGRGSINRLKPPFFGRSVNTTRSTYFRLLAMGLDPNSSTLLPSGSKESTNSLSAANSRAGTPVLNSKTRSLADSTQPTAVGRRGMPSASVTAQKPTPQPSSRKRTFAESSSPEEQAVNGNPNKPAKRPATTPSRRDSKASKTFSSPEEEDEELFAVVRNTCRAMKDSITFFKDEVTRESASPSSAANTSPIGTPNGPPSVLSNSVANVHLKVPRVGPEMRKSPMSDVATTGSSSRFNEPPLKYRNRVSKFLPRERYADRLMQQRKDTTSVAKPSALRYYATSNEQESDRSSFSSNQMPSDAMSRAVPPSAQPALGASFSSVMEHSQPAVGSPSSSVKEHNQPAARAPFSSIAEHNQPVIGNSFSSAMEHNQPDRPMSSSSFGTKSPTYPPYKYETKQAFGSSPSPPPPRRRNQPNLPESAPAEASAPKSDFNAVPHSLGANPFALLSDENGGETPRINDADEFEFAEETYQDGQAYHRAGSVTASVERDHEEVQSDHEVINEDQEMSDLDEVEEYNHQEKPRPGSVDEDGDSEMTDSDDEEEEDSDDQKLFDDDPEDEDEEKAPVTSFNGKGGTSVDDAIEL